MVSLRVIVAQVMTLLVITICAMQAPAKASTTYPLKAIAEGTVTITLLTPPFIEGEFNTTFTYFTPFPLTTGYFYEFSDLSIPTFPEKQIETFYSLTAPNGDGFSGNFSVLKSELINDLTEVGNGTFTITEGTGVYAGATGSGTFSTVNVFTDLSLTFGYLDAEILGFVTLPISVAEPSTLMLFGTGFAWMLFGFTRRRCREIGSGEVGLSAILGSPPHVAR
jgi:hypothetical protein